MRGVMVWLALAACGRSGFEGVGDGSTTPARREKRIAFHDVVAPVTNFRLPINLGADSDIAPHAESAYFVDDNGATLAQEREDTTAWVLVPRIDAATTLRVRYGGEPQLADPGPVWTGTLGIWHLTDNELQFRDSSGAGHFGLPMGTPVDVQGIAGRARDFDGVDDSIYLGDPADGGLDVGTSSITYSVWVHVTSPAGPFDLPFWKGGSSNTYPGYDLECGTSNWSANISDGVVTVGANFAVSSSALMGRWVFLAAVVDRGTGELRTYTDGILAETRALGGIGSLSSSNVARIGDGTLTEPFRGSIDEFRIELGVVSATELYMRFQVLASPQNVYTIGPEELW